jgi:GPH family glycoside/pentoside/hexuronide:cation symporter
MLTAQVQMFTYVSFMQFSHTEKTIAHGAGMLAFAFGALFQAWLVVRIDKKPTAFASMLVSAGGGILLLIVFIGGLLDPQASWYPSEGIPLIGGREIPVAVLVFALLQSLWWGGMGMLAPLMLSMVADVSEINYVRSGQLKDGSYSAMFSFFMKAAAGAGLFINGWLLEFAGYQAGADSQVPEVIRNVAIITFVSGPLVLIPLAIVIYKYPVDRAFMKDIKGALADQRKSV